MDPAQLLSSEETTRLFNGTHVLAFRSRTTTTGQWLCQGIPFPSEDLSCYHLVTVSWRDNQVDRGPQTVSQWRK